MTSNTACPRPYTKLPCPLCPGKGPWMREKAFVRHAVAPEHLRVLRQVESVGASHPFYNSWQAWRAAVRLDEHMRKVLNEDEKLSRQLRQQYDARVQLLWGPEPSTLTPFVAEEGELLDEDEFGTDNPWGLPIDDRCGELIPPHQNDEDWEELDQNNWNIERGGEDSVQAIYTGGLGIDEASWDTYFANFQEDNLADILDQAIADQDQAGHRVEYDAEDIVPNRQHHRRLQVKGQGDQACAFDHPPTWFTPPRDQDPHIDHVPENPWYPFESEIFARLFIFINCRTDPLTRRQCLRVWELLKRFSIVPVPSYTTVRNFDKSIPRPRIYSLSTGEEVPRTYTQVSVTDQIRMQLAIPGVARQIQEMPIMRYHTHAQVPTTYSDIGLPNLGAAGQQQGISSTNTYCLERAELWTGRKWLTTPSLQPPMVTLDNQTEVWFGMIVQFRPTADVCHGPSVAQHEPNPILPNSNWVPSTRFGLLCGQSLLEVDGRSTPMIHYYPLMSLPFHGAAGLVFGNPNLQIQSIYVQQTELSSVARALSAKLPAGPFGAVTTEQDTANLTEIDIYVSIPNSKGDIAFVPPEVADFDRVFRPHPVRENRNRISPTLPVKVVNISIWQDGLSGNASKKWNPHEGCLMSLAGLPRHITDSVYGNLFVSCARDIKGVYLLDGVVAEIARLQRGILAWDADSIGQKMTVVTGSIVQVKVDNPAASDLCNHMWQSSFPCRLCLFNSGRGAKGSELRGSPLDILVPGQMRDCVSALALLLANEHEVEGRTGEHGLRIKERLSPLFSIPGLDPFKDTPWEKLHSFLLGPAKEATRALLKFPAITAQKNSIRMFIDAMSWDTIRGSLAGRRVMQWSGSFVGSDFKVFLQIAPFILNQFLSYHDNDRPEDDLGSIAPVNQIYKSIRDLFTYLAELNKLLYVSTIVDLQAWQGTCSRLITGIIRCFSEWQGTGPKEANTPTVAQGSDPEDTGDQAFDRGVERSAPRGRTRSSRARGARRPQAKRARKGTHYPSQGESEHLTVAAPGLDYPHVIDFTKKPKFHLLTHVNYWTDRFGPPRNSHTETEEYLNSVIRDKLHHSNRQAPSGDTAESFATLEGVTFIARGGIWRKKGEDMMTAAGASFLKIFETEEVWREMVGLDKVAVDGNVGSKNPGQRLESKVSLSRIDDPRDRAQLDLLGVEYVDIWDSCYLLDGTKVTTNGTKSFVQAKEGGYYRILHIYIGPPRPQSRILRIDHNLEQSRPIFMAGEEYCSAGLHPELNCYQFSIRAPHNWRVLQLDGIQNAVNMQHLCSTSENCGIKDTNRAWMEERLPVAGRAWRHGDDGIYVLNRFCLGAQT